MKLLIKLLFAGIFITICSFLYTYAVGLEKKIAYNFYFVSKNKEQIYISNIRNNINLKSISSNIKLNNGDLVFYNEGKLIKIIGNNNINIVKTKTTFYDDIEDFIKLLDEEKLQKLINIYKNDIYNNYLIEHIFIKIGGLDNIIKEKKRKVYFYNNVGKRLLMDGNIISREEWGADETWGTPAKYKASCPNGNCWGGQTSERYNRVKDNYIKNFEKEDNNNIINLQNSFTKEYQEYLPIRQIFIHHTAGILPLTKKEGISNIKGIYSYHALKLGWGDIGYHYLIDGEGNIYEGNRGGMYSVGTHIYGHNKGSIGISLMGNSKYTSEQLKSLEKLVIYLAKEYKLNLSEELDVRKAELDGIEKGYVIGAHKEVDKSKPVDPNINMGDFRKKFLNNENYNFDNF